MRARRGRRPESQEAKEAKADSESPASPKKKARITEEDLQEEPADDDIKDRDYNPLVIAICLPSDNHQL